MTVGGKGRYEPDLAPEILSDPRRSGDSSRQLSGFNTVLTRVEIGHIRIKSAGIGRIAAVSTISRSSSVGA